MFVLSEYHFSLLAWTNLIVALIVFYLGISVFVRERYTPVSRAFLIMCFSTGLWLFCISFVIAAVHQDLAQRWGTLVYIGEPLIPAAVFHFTVHVLQQYGRRKMQVRMAWVASFVSVVMLVSTDVLYSGLHLYSWGFYPKLSGKSIIFVGYFLFVMVIVLRMFRDEYKAVRPRTVRWFRARGFQWSILSAYLGSIDFLPSYGVPIPPVGAVFVLAACILAARAVWRYRFVDVTPALAVNTIIDTMSDALLIVDPEGVIRHSNNAAERLFNMRKHVLEGKEVADVLSSENCACGVQGLFCKTDVHAFETIYDGGPAGPRMLTVSASLIRDRAQKPAAIVYTAQDVTDNRQAEEKIRFLAYYDPLTGLPNRTFYKEILGRAIAYAKRHKVVMATMFIDLDSFKQINDTYGHCTGDELLKVVAMQLTKCVRKTDYVARSDDERVPDTVSRLGGDEFIVLLNEIREGGDAARVALRILDMLSRPLVVGGHEVFISASIGISLFPGDGETVDVLLKNADAAMYVAKSSGKNRYQFYSNEMNSSSRNRLDMEMELQSAVEAQQFVVYYQPRYDLGSNALVGMEALVRWDHPSRGILLPEEFIPLAEETGHIILLGEQVLRAACMQVAEWIAEGRKAVPVAVNLCGRQCNERLVETIGRLLSETGLEPRFLELEITERAIMKDPDKVLPLVRDCRSKGIRVSLDDFGTGFSSLGQLRDLPLDALKIDRSFVMNVMKNERDAAVVRTIIAIGRNLGLRVIAEGVENEAQLALVRSFGCDEAQGFHFSEAVPGSKAVRYIEEHGKRRTKRSAGFDGQQVTADYYQI